MEAQTNDSFAFASPTSVGAFDIPDEPIPTTNEGREKYFMNHLQLGEQLMLQGIMLNNQKVQLRMTLPLPVSTEPFKSIQNHRNC